MSANTIVMGITGASGGPYAVRLLDGLEAAGVRVHLIVSPHGSRLLAEECGIPNATPANLLGRNSDRIHVEDYNDVGAGVASGSYLTDGMVICPCSSNTLAAVAAGRGDNLMARAAHVCLKERRRLVLVHREMPLSGIDLDNMRRLQEAGAVICPASPGFYHRPETIADLVDFVVGRVLDLLGVAHSLNVRWDGHGSRPAGLTAGSAPDS